MTCFSKFYKKEKLVSRTLDIDEELYIELERLSNEVYDASILIRRSFLEGLYQLKKKYRIPIYLLVNIAIRNVLIEEREIKKCIKQ